MTTSSASTIESGTSFPAFSASTSIIIMNTNVFSADPGCSETSSLKLLFLQPLFHILNTYPVLFLCTFPGPALFLRIVIHTSSLEICHYPTPKETRSRRRQYVQLSSNIKAKLCFQSTRETHRHPNTASHGNTQPIRYISKCLSTSSQLRDCDCSHTRRHHEVARLSLLDTNVLNKKTKLAEDHELV